MNKYYQTINEITKKLVQLFAVITTPNAFLPKKNPKISTLPYALLKTNCSLTEKLPQTPTTISNAIAKECNKELRNTIFWKYPLNIYKCLLEIPIKHL